MLVVPAGTAHAAEPVDVFIADVDDRPDPAYSHSTVSYVISVGNRGLGTATAVTLTAQLPTGVSFQPSGSDERCSPTLTTVTCDLSTVSGTGMASPLVIGVTPTTDRLLSMTFTVSAAEPDADVSDNTQTETTTVTMPVDADVSLNLDAGAGPRYAGEPFFISAGLFNFGPAPATGATTVLRLPTGLSVESSGASCIPDVAGAVCTIRPMDLPPTGGSVALLQMSASAAGDYTISGSLTADQPDPQPANNTDSVTFTVMPAADVAVTVVESADPTGPGQPLTYTVTATNHGPSPASAVSLTDRWSGAVSGGLTLLTVGASQGQCVLIAPDRINCELGQLASGATAAVTIRLRPRGVGSVTNQAQVTATEHDRDPANNLATKTTLVR
ncbi:hypothetical protein [Micromonospora sp. NPDC049497]|uniref:hypothetical protein n=1 Tax=Micromonospora sp. NPDC049497 TaxID=3364273 RepID=UPI00379C6D02